MPSPETIVQGLTRVANDFIPLALAWHVALVATLVGAATRRFQPTQRLAGALLALPVLSVGVLAWRTGNPFNGTVFVALTVALLLVARRLSARRVSCGPRWAVGLGLVAIAYAAVYPHFVALESVWLYPLVAPVGLVPCPTLSLVVGFGLLADSLDSRAWSLTVGLAALAYALFGMLALGVWLDLGLLVAGCGLLIRELSAGRERASRR